MQIKKSAQLVFCDMSTPSSEFNIYDDIKNKLIEWVSLKGKLKFIHNANNNREKDAIFDKVRERRNSCAFRFHTEDGSRNQCTR